MNICILYPAKSLAVLSKFLRSVFVFEYSQVELADNELSLVYMYVEST